MPGTVAPRVDPCLSQIATAEHLYAPAAIPRCGDRARYLWLGTALIRIARPMSGRAPTCGGVSGAQRNCHSDKYQRVPIDWISLCASCPQVNEPDRLNKLISTN